ncbi:MAG: hypothetical protein SNJ77_08075 [Cytophagales bacterium]
MVKLWKKGLLETLKMSLVFGILSVIPFILWNIIFYKFYFPNAPQSTKLFKEADYSIANLSKIVSEYFEKVIFAEGYWGYFVYIVLALLVVDLILFKKWKGYFYWVSMLIFFTTFLLIDLYFVHFNVEFTFRRGFFKFIAVAGFYLSQLELFARVSKLLTKFEGI